MHKSGGKIVLWGLVIGALVFTAIRTIHFLQMTFPPDQQYVAYIGLLMFDAGVLAWLYYATNSAEGAQQRAIAYGMIFVCAAGVSTTTVMDMTMVAQANGLYHAPVGWFTVGLWAVIIVIIANFMAGICVHLTDPKQRQKMEVQHVQDEIHNLTLQKIREQKDTIAPRIASQVAQHWADQTVLQMTGHLTAPRALPAPDAVSLAQTNYIDTDVRTSESVEVAQNTGPIQKLPKHPKDCYCT